MNQRYSLKRARAYERKFDYDECLRRLAKGEKASDLAAEYGVTTSAIYQARRRPNVTTTKPVFDQPTPGKCPTCQGHKAKDSIQCRECNADDRLRPPVLVRRRRQRSAILASVALGRVVRYKGEWAVVEQARQPAMRARWRELHYWDAPVETVSCTVKVYVAPYTEIVT